MGNKKRAIIIVIDSMGIGAMPDCKAFGDTEECNTLKNVCAFNHGLRLPNLEKLGLGNIQDFEGISKTSVPMGQYGTLREKSKGKDTTTGHWEIAGHVSEQPFATYPEGFPKELIDKFVQKTGCKGVLANIPASGTAIIEKLNDEHHKTGYPIVYTSADSVFQIALDTDMIPLETLYSWCRIARQILDEGNYNTARVIARPYKVIDGKPTRISKDRRDYSMQPPEPTVLDKVKDAGAKVIGIGKIEDIFSKAGITHAIHTGSNKEGLEQADIWSKRSGADIVRKDKADPASVVYEAIHKAKNEKYDVLLVDTAGRLQNKFNLMEELAKIKTVIDKNSPDALRESILVIDANTGQNGLQQAKVFKECVDLTSVALTKLDGSAKGGIILGIAKDLNLPVKLVGVGEKMEDLKNFDSKEFINALFV